MRLQWVALPFGFISDSALEGTVEAWTKRALTTILSRAAKFVTWPTQIEQTVKSAHLKSTFGMPNCIGLTAGRHIVLSGRPARDDAGAFMSWKGGYGLLVVAVFDHDYRICHLHYGFPLSLGDWRVQRMMEPLTDPANHFGPMEYILGGLRMTPGWNCVTMCFQHGGCSRVFEQTFGLLKSRFPALRSLPHKLRTRRTQALAHSVILAACMLHNLLLNNLEPVDLVNNDNKYVNNTDRFIDIQDNNRIQERSQQRKLLVDKIIVLDDGETDMDTLDLI